ncbi:hypothetical protein ACET3Z_016124 [Daucus carota]
MPPPVDLDALDTSCTTASDRKIACEQVADADGNSHSPSRSSDAAEEFNDVPPDFPAESFWLSQDAEFDWFDRNAFLERKESTRGNICSATNQSNNTTSQRFAKQLNSKAAILGMPNTQKSNHVDNKRRQSKAPIMRLFPSKRSESIKSTAGIAEPSSPKVSCIGRVRSKKSRSRRRKVTVKAVVERTRSADEVKKKKGFYSGLMSLFRSDRKCTNKGSVRISEPVVKSVSRKKKCEDPIQERCESACEPVGLGGMTRFVSGRRSESWIVGEESDAARYDSLEAFRKSGSTRRL